MDTKHKWRTLLSAVNYFPKNFVLDVWLVSKSASTTDIQNYPSFTEIFIGLIVNSESNMADLTGFTFVRTETANGGAMYKHVFSKISQISQGNTCSGVPF